MINYKSLSAINDHKHLGIWIESSLKWDSHINCIVGKANRVLGLIRKTFGSKDFVAIKTAFKVFVRPILEYACHVWNAYLSNTFTVLNPSSVLPLVRYLDKPYSDRLTGLN